MSSLPPLFQRKDTDRRSIEHPSSILARSLRRTTWTGIAVCAAFFGGFGTWAAVAPLAGAAIAPGLISPDGNRRSIQHLEGGIIRDLLVRDGSRVETGQPLLVLEARNAHASHDMLLKEYRSTLAIRFRLMAERDRTAEVAFETAEFGDDDSELAGLFAAQRALFASRRDARLQRKKIQQQRISQLQEEIAGLNAQIASQATQLKLLREEAKSVSDLVQQGYERRPRLLGLQRNEAEIAGAKSANEALIAKANEAITEAETQISSISAQHMEEVETQLSEVTANLAGIREKLRAAADVVHRTVITAPVTGTIVQLKVNTIGGVVGPGQTILEIVPRDEELLIDARISPNDIDEVKADQPAHVIMTGHKQRNMPRIEGRVREVSADRIVDPQTGQAYYLARIELQSERLRDLGSAMDFKPGMPAEVMVLTGERTLLNYLLEPLRSSFRRTFREA